MQKQTKTPSIILLAVASLTLLLPGCSLFDKNVELAIFSDNDANVNAKGQPAPIVIHAMTLKDQGMIQKIQVTDLYSLKSGIVGPDIVKLSTLNILPKMQHKSTIKIEDNDKFLAVTGLFRRHKGVKWKTVIPTKDIPRKVYLIAGKSGLKSVTRSEYYTHLNAGK